MTLIAHYKLSDANDSSGNGRNGAATDVSYVAGKLGQAASFNGTTSIINCGSEFIGTSALTIAAWIFLNGWGEGTAGSESGRILDNGKTLLWVQHNTGDLRFSRDGGTTPPQSANTISLSSWIHVAVTSTASGTTNFYVNGFLSGTANQAAGTPAAGTTNVCLGNRLATDRAFNGLLDDVRIYNEILPDWKIQAIFNFGKGSDLCEPWQRVFQPVIRPIVQPLAGVSYGH
jgi:hypothetical protein